MSLAPLMTQNAPEPRGGFRQRARRARSFAVGIGLTGIAFIAAAVLLTEAATGQETFPEPDEYISEGGVLTTSLTVARQTVDIAGTPIAATVYN